MGGYKQVKVNLDPEVHESLELDAVSMNMNLAEYFRYRLGIDFSGKSRFRKNRTQDNSKKLDKNLLYFLSSISKEINAISENLKFGKMDTRLILISLLEIRELLKNFESKTDVN